MAEDLRERDTFSSAMGMANYTDKVIKAMEPEAIKQIQDWQGVCEV